MAFTVVWEPSDRQFIGRAAIENRQPASELVGLIMEAKGVLRSHQTVYQGDVEIGEITSGAYSPTLGYAIALARIKHSDKSGNGDLFVEIRNRKLPVRRVLPPFVRNGKKVYKTV